AFRREGLDARYFQNLPERIHHVLQLGGLRQIGKIESLNDALLEFFTLRWVIRSDENGVWGYWPPEGLRFEGNDLQSLFERNRIQLNLNPARRVFGIKQNINSR